MLKFHMSMNNRLDGWKEIASYVNKGVATVQRWEKDGFPIRRLPGKQSVYALSKDIDNWFKQKDQFEQSNKPLFLNTPALKTQKGKGNKKNILIIVVCFVLLLIFFRAHYVNKDSFKLYSKLIDYANGTLITIYNYKNERIGQIKSSFRKQLLVEKNLAINTFYIKDLNKDNKDEIILTTLGENNNPEVKLYKQNRNEKLELYKKWKLNTRLVYNQKIFDTFFIGDMECVDLDGDKKPEISVLVNNFPYYPSCLRVFDEEGNVKFEFWHPGRLENVLIMDFDRDGQQEIYLSGTNNFVSEYSSAVFMKISADWKKIKTKKISLFGAEHKMINNVPIGFKVVYVKFLVDYIICFDKWQKCKIRKDLSRISGEKIHLDVGLTHMSPYGVNDKRIVEKPGRNFEFNSEMEVEEKIIQKGFLDQIGKKINDPEIQELLTPYFWNGTNWQKEVCSIPQK